MTIKRATLEDIPEIVKLNSALFKEDGGTRDDYVNKKWPSQEGKDHFKKLIDDRKNTLCLVVVGQHNIIGYLVGYLKKVESWRPVRRTEIESMYVIPQFRNQKIGQKLIEKFLQWSKKKRAKRILVSAFAANERAISFYVNNSFRPFQVSLEADITKEKK